jgi:glycosyltransferase involved in cell wall biosynthesis
MKVILSVEPIRYPLTGIGRYTLELAHQLAQLPKIETLRYFSGSDFVTELPDPDLELSPVKASALSTAKSLVGRNPLLLEAHRFLHQRRQRRNLGGTEGYVYHGPNFYLPPVVGPAVVTFHDLSILTMPECHPPERVNYMRKEMMVALERASLIITDAEYGRREVAEYFGWPLDRIRAVHLAGSDSFFPRPHDEVAVVLAEFGIQPGSYTLYAGTIEPRKNLERLLAAYGKLPTALRMRHPLILAGFKGWNNDAIMERIREGVSQGWVRYLGYLPEEKLPYLFAGARLFAFPSLYEGFGLPVLEAMASGVPVVCSSSSSLPEVAGSAAAMCAPEDVEELHALLWRGLEDESWRETAISEGLVQARRFSWQRCAQETANVYDEALKVGMNEGQGKAAR